MALPVGSIVTATTGVSDAERLMADNIPDARLILYPDSGHIWLGHNDALTREIADFVAQTDQT